MDRRRFLGSSVGAGLWLAAAGCARSDADAAGRGNGGAGGDAAADPGDGEGRASRISAWGVQLYTVRSLMARDVERTLADVSRVGYREVEFAGYFDRSPAEIRAILDAEGLTAPATHLSLDVFRRDLESALEAAGTIGHRYLVLPSLPAAELSSVERVRALAGEMNRFGERCAEAEVGFAFHNHDAELAPLEGEVPLRLLLEGTDPHLVTFEVDLFWLVHGGGDPFDYFEAYPGRFTLCHVKDRTAGGEMVDVGAGAIDFAAIFARSEQAGLEHYFVEHDNPPDPLASIRASYEHLASLPA